jgi:hypothetical protein
MQALRPPSSTIPYFFWQDWTVECDHLSSNLQPFLVPPLPSDVIHYSFRCATSQLIAPFWRRNTCLDFGRGQFKLSTVYVQVSHQIKRMQQSTVGSVDISRGVIRRNKWKGVYDLAHSFVICNQELLWLLSKPRSEENTIFDHDIVQPLISVIRCWDGTALVEEVRADRTTHNQPHHNSINMHEVNDIYLRK